MTLSDDRADAMPAGDEPLPGLDLAEDPDSAGDLADDADGPEPAYLSVEDWVAEHFLPTFRRVLGGEYRWCGQWWRHGEAVSRLTALWHAWEVMRLRPGTGIAAWYRDYLDPQLPVLMGPRGPFCQCTETSHRDPRQAAADPSPADWWDASAGEPADALPPGEDREHRSPS